MLNCFMNLKFLGAAGTVTGSNFLLTLDNGSAILVDMGMFQGTTQLEELNQRQINFSVKNVKSVLVTHAHLDHVGRLPILIKNGYLDKFYMTQATREIAEVVLLDAARIMKNDNSKPILYTEEHVFSLLNQVTIVSYGQEIDLGAARAIFRDAGHILGSGSIELETNNKKIVFSGDLGNTPEDLVKPTEYIDNADTVIMESTYGDRNHPEENPDIALLNEIKTIEETGGVLLIPSFSVERTQALLHKIAHFKKEGKIKPQTPFFLDSPMGEKVTEIYKRFATLLNSELIEDANSGDPFSFPGRIIVDSYSESQKIRELEGCKVIIAGSGMMNGGRVLAHAVYYLPMQTTRILIVGFQAEKTIGRQIEEGARSVNIEGVEVPVNATVTALHSMSAHADQNKLLKWFTKISGVKKVFLVHGEDIARLALQEKINITGVKVALPHLDESTEI